jgi:DNA polymerase-3 subunit gamma/tau
VLTTTLQKEIDTGNVGQAYLFCGPRGTGKTTTARIFARKINGNIIELDAASNSGVEHIRNLRQDVMYLPTDGALYKIYIRCKK